jgi:hypothetical protein
VRSRRTFQAWGSACALLLATCGVVLAAGAGGAGGAVHVGDAVGAGGAGGAVGAGAAVGAVDDGSATADTIIPLPGLTYLSQTVPDTVDGNSYLFIAANSEIIVTSLAGKQSATIDSGDGIDGLALSADGGTVYASVTSGADADSIAAIAVSSVASGTPKQVFYPLAAGDQPGSVAVQSGKVWVGYTPTADAVTTWRIGAIDLAGGGAFEAAATPGSWAAEPLLAADPDGTGVLVAVDHESPTEAASYKTTTDPATPIAARGELGGGASACSYLAQVAVLPGGKQFAAACMGAGVDAYNTADLSEAASYNANGAGASLTVGVAVNADGTVAVSNRSDIYVYKRAGGLLNTLEIGAGDEITEGNGLAWLNTPDGPALAAAYGVGDSAPYAVEIFDQAEGRPSVTFTASATTSLGHPIKLSGASRLPSGAADTGQVTITRSGPGGPVTLRAVTPSSAGAFSVTDTPKAVGTYTYTATSGATSATATAKVIRDIPALSVTPASSVVGYKTVVHLTATLGTTHVNRDLTIYAEVNGSGKNKVIASGKVNAKGQLDVAYTALESTTFRVAYAGDADDAPVQASAVLSVRAQVQQALSGQYGTKKFGDTTYLLYHRAGKVTAVIAVTPGHPGGCVELETQEFAKGAWHASAKTGCATLSQGSKATADLTLGKAEVGSRYRVRADYLTNSPANASSASSWEYFMVEK